MKRLLVFAIAAALLCGSCKKENETEPTKVTQPVPYVPYSDTVTGPGGKARFCYDHNSGTHPLSVHFQNWSFGWSVFEWQFGNSVYSIMTSPSNTYPDAGIYIATLYVQDSLGNNVDSVSTTITVH